MSPRDPQGAETRSETKTEWVNVYAYKLLSGEQTEARIGGFQSEADADTAPWFRNLSPTHLEPTRYPRIAVERIETTTTISRIPCAGEGQ